MQVRPLESLTKEELIELIKQEREVFQAFVGWDEPTPTQIAHWLADHEAQLGKTDLGKKAPDNYELEYHSDDMLGRRFTMGPDPLALILGAMK